SVPSAWQRKSPDHVPPVLTPPSAEPATRVAAARLLWSASSGQSSRPIRVGLSPRSYCVEIRASSKGVASSPCSRQPPVLSSPCPGASGDPVAVTTSSSSPFSTVRYLKVAAPATTSPLHRAIWPSHLTVLAAPAGRTSALQLTTPRFATGPAS